MGVWALEFDPGLTGNVYEMVEFNGDLFAFCYSGTGSGVWRRTPPNWTRTLDFGGGGRACVWDGRMWAGSAIPWHISVSEDGVVWTTDHDFSCGGPYSHWSALGGYGNYLYAYQYAMCGITNAFYQRDTDGNWTQYPPDAGLTVGHGNDVIGYGGRVYWSYASNVRYYDSAWHLEPTIGTEAYVYFTVHNGILYAAGGDGEAWRKTSGGWSKEMDIGNPWGRSKAISIGDDGNLWLTLNDTADSRVYVRQGGMWFLHSAAVGVRFNSAIAHEGFASAGTNSCEFYRYDPDFDLTPEGGGLYPQALDCDADGGYLYICVYDAAGQPVLVRAQLPLVEADMGLGAFVPGAGDSVSVKATAVGGKLAVAGRFSAGGNDSVQVSEDFGGTWADIAPNWADTAQPLLVDPDTVDEMMVALDANQDIVETFDGGATPWLTRNAGVGYSPGAMARLPEGGELVVGDDAANTIEFSPNRGVTLHDITGIFQGNCQALEVI